MAENRLLMTGTIPISTAERQIREVRTSGRIDAEEPEPLGRYARSHAAANDFRDKVRASQTTLRSRGSTCGQSVPATIDGPSGTLSYVSTRRKVTRTTGRRRREPSDEGGCGDGQRDGKGTGTRDDRTMRDRIGTFEGTRPRNAGVNVTKSRVMGCQKVRNPLVGLDKHVYILMGRCTYPF